MYKKFDNSVLRQNIIASIRSNLPLSAVAGRAGVSTRTLKNWLNRGCEALRREDLDEVLTEEDRTYAKFYFEVKAAEAQAQSDLLFNISQSDDWRASSWVLERRHKDFAEKKKIDIAVSNVKEGLLAHLEENLSKETFAEVLNALIDFDDTDDD
jgi:transcriptional regulator with XRE-family HTH domain